MKQVFNIISPTFNELLGKGVKFKSYSKNIKKIKREWKYINDWDKEFDLVSSKFGDKLLAYKGRGGTMGRIISHVKGGKTIYLELHCFRCEPGLNEEDWDLRIEEYSSKYYKSIKFNSMFNSKEVENKKELIRSEYIKAIEHSLK